jgi:cyclopropane-fatty-acyl-phospholipid synthase
MLEKITSDQLFKRLDKIESGTLNLTTPDGQKRVFSGRNPGENAHLELRDWRVVGNMMRKGDIGFAEDYRVGKWDSENLVSLTALGLNNRDVLQGLVTGSEFSRTKSMLSYLLRLNSIKGSKKNIHAHYDLGNDFYKLWLDPTMTYSSGIFKSPDESLETSQHNKYDRILDCLNSNGGSLLEIGCGWGGFAKRAQARGSFGIKGLTLSQEQHDYAARKLGSGVNIALEDYRQQNGTFDNIVSIEMFEAVGERYWPTYFNKVGSLLNKNGKAVIQTITMNDENFPRYRKSGDFIRSYIFPGGMLPSPSRFDEEVLKSGLKAENAFSFGQDYARTLQYWLDSFDQKRDEVKALGFDDSFIRLWRFYLAACIAGFKTGHTDVMQVELSHA